MYKICFVIYSLNSGGAERVLSLIANELNERKFNVEIAVFTSDKPFYKINKNIRINYLNLARYSKTNFKKFISIFEKFIVLKRFFKAKKFDIIISFIDNINLICILTKGKTPIIITEHSDNSIFEINYIKKIMQFLLYRFAYLINVSKGIEKNFKFHKNKTVIYNPLPPDIDNLINENLNLKEDFILNVGRLEFAKNQEILMKAYSKLNTNLKLYILGEGSLRKNLEILINKLNLSEKVILKGAVSNPFPYYKKAKFFVLSSRYEGFGNVLIESLACAKTVISYNCKSGPSEIITHEVNGLLVENQDENALKNAMQRLIDDECFREKLNKNAIAAKEKYSIKNITDEYEKIIKKILKERYC